MTTDPGVTLQRKLANLADDVEHRLYLNETSNQRHLLQAMLDRMFELLAYDIIRRPIDADGTGHVLCHRCRRYTATVQVHAGSPGTNHYRCQLVCVHCTLASTVWAGAVGAVHVRPINPREVP
jgi:hypothetical protein